MQSVLPLDPDERIEAIIDTRDYESHKYLVCFTRKGQVKKTKFSDYDSRNQVLVAISLADDDEVVAVRATSGETDLVMVTRNAMAICFSEEDARPMGRDTRGVRGIKLRDGDEVVSAATVTEGEEILILTSGGYGKRTAMSQFPKQKRGGIGVKAMKLTRVRGGLVAALALNREDQIFITSSDGIVIRQSAGEISRQKRASTGVKVMSLSEGTVLAAAALVPRDDEEEEG